MTTIELKSLLIHRIEGINDKSFLNAIMTIIEPKSVGTIHKTTPEQRQNIEEGREQVASGNYYTNEQIEAVVDKWLKEK